MNRHRASVFAGSMLAILLSACADRQAVMPAMLETPSAAVSATTSVTAEALSIQCAESDIALIGTDRDARVETHRGAASRGLIRPDGMDGFVPVGLGCAHSISGDAYLVVQYGERPRGCKVCEWFFVYDQDGKPMNESVPPMRGEGASINPNNDGYTHLVRTLGLKHPEMQYLPAPQR